jgi:polar amino acid transport system permease protein
LSAHFYESAVLAQRRAETWDWDFVGEILPDLLRGLWLTIQITVLGLVVAMTLGLVFAILRRSQLRVVRWPLGLFVDFVRSTPLLVQFFFLFFVLPDFGITLSGMQVGVLGLGVHYASYTSESYRAGIESVPRGQWEGSTALNLRTSTTWRSVVLPQAIPTVIPALGNYLVAAFKDAPLVAAIGLLDVLGTARSLQGVYFRGLEPFTLAGLLFLAVSIPAAMFARYLERRYGFQRE